MLAAKSSIVISLIGCLFVAQVIFLAPGLAKSNLVERPPQPLLPNVEIDSFNPATKQVAEQLEVWHLLQELHDKVNRPSEERKRTIRLKIHETIMESYFDAMSVQSEAMQELGELGALREKLTSRKDHAVQKNNATNFIASGALNTIGSILGFSESTPPFSGNLNQMLSGVVSTSMSTYAIKQNAGGKTAGQGRPNVISEIFGRPTDDRTVYPESVWRFIHGMSLHEPGKTRVQVLEDRWIAREHIEPHGSPREITKLNLVCGVLDKKRLMTIEDISDEMSMISDVSAVVTLLTHHLRDLLRVIDSDHLD